MKLCTIADGLGSLTVAAILVGVGCPLVSAALRANPSSTGLGLGILGTLLVVMGVVIAGWALIDFFNDFVDSELDHLCEPGTAAWGAAQATHPEPNREPMSNRKQFRGEK